MQMNKSILALGALCVTLTSCGPPEPVIIPEDAIEAGRTCFVAQGMLLREGKTEGDPVTYEEFAQSLRFAIAAAAQVEPFSTDKVGEVLSNVDGVQETIANQDLAGAIPACEARFGIDDKVELPEEDPQAVLSCLSLASFMQGATQSQAADFGTDASDVGPLFERMQARMQNDPEVLVAMIGGDTETMLNEATRSAFAEGAPREYVAACNARFPAEE